MTGDLDTGELYESILALYRADPDGGAKAVKAYLQDRLRDLPMDEKLKALECLVHHCPEADPADAVVSAFMSESALISAIFSMILGKDASQEGLGSIERLERLAASLNTVFDNLNQLICIIRSTFTGGGEGGLQTIRHVIGSQLNGEAADVSLDGYVNQIREAFLTTHAAFKQAAQAKMEEVLRELSPESLEQEGEGGLKFGPFRRAELYDAYLQKYEKAREWYQSGRFEEDFLREFERACQKAHAQKGG